MHGGSFRDGRKKRYSKKREKTEKRSQKSVRKKRRKRKEKKRKAKKTATGDAVNKIRISVESAKAPRRRFEGCKAVNDYEQRYPIFVSVRFYNMECMCLL